MFALTSAFMGATLVGSFNAHTESINQERTALQRYIYFANFTPELSTQNLQYRVKQYLESALEEEWPLLEYEKTSKKTEELFQGVISSTMKLASALEGTQAGRELPKILDSWNEARSKRLSFRLQHIEILRWSALIMVAFLLQISVAAIHLGSPRRVMSLTLGVTTSLIIAVITPLAINVNHFSGLLEVSKIPIYEVYEILSEQFVNDR
jgi:hypothetical protein